jgi:hypothetical protein
VLTTLIAANIRQARMQKPFRAIYVGMLRIIAGLFDVASTFPASL